MNTANNINIRYGTNSLKINDNFFLKIQIQKTFFLAHFLNIFGEKFFSRKSGSVTNNWPNSEKSNDPIPRKHKERQEDGKM